MSWQHEAVDLKSCSIHKIFFKAGLIDWEVYPNLIEDQLINQNFYMSFQKNEQQTVNNNSNSQTNYK